MYSPFMSFTVSVRVFSEAAAIVRGEIEWVSGNRLISALFIDEGSSSIFFK
jgi:hypothetical protein